MTPMNCNYCGEESRYTILIPKPNYCLLREKAYPLVQVFGKQDHICLPCLEFEIRECY